MQNDPQSSRRERRAAAFEAIAHALLELAAVEREPETTPSAREILIDHRNCEEQLGLTPRAFTAAAARGDFPAFRVSKRQTATKDDVLSWLKSRKVEPKPKPAPAATPPDPDAFLKPVDPRFVARVGRRMTDYELDSAEICISVVRQFAKMTGGSPDETPDEIARRVAEKIGSEPAHYRDWRSLGLDPLDMERRAEELRVGLHREHPEMGWRERMSAINKMWDDISAPLSEARSVPRAAARAAKKTERAKAGKLGLKR